MAKLIRISDDGGSNYFTFPGATGDLTRDAEGLSDTVFGQTFESQEIGLIGWQVSANAFYKGFAGYQADIKKPGSTTAFTTEDFTLVSGKTYRIDDASRSIWDRAVPANFVFYDTAVDKTAEVLSVNFLFGEVTFKASYTVTGAVTADGDFFPTAVLGTANSYTLTMTDSPIDTTDFATAQANGGFRTMDPGLRTVGIDLTGIYTLGNTFAADLIARNELIIEVDAAGDGLSIARGFFKIVSHGESGDVGGLEEETVSFALTVPDPALALPATVPFGWQHGGTSTLSTAIIKALDAFNAQTKPKARYMPDGVIGDEGDVVITDISLSGGLESMNEFSVTMAGDGAPVAF